VIIEHVGLAKMIDCLDKQQSGAKELVFWPQQLQVGQPQRQPTAQLPTQASSIGQQQQQHPAEQLLVDVDQPAGQTGEPEPALQAIQQQQQQQLQQCANNELIGYYFGSISRETAEWILKNHGNRLDGAYLLRSSGPKDDFVLSLMVVNDTGVVARQQQQSGAAVGQPTNDCRLEVLHYKIVETDDSFVALHGQVGDEKFATIDELIEKAQGVATKPRWPIQRQSLESQILPPTFWGLTVDQIRLAILIKAKQWGFSLPNFQQPAATTQLSNAYPAAADQQPQQSSDNMATTANGINTLNNETIRTLIYKSLHEFQPWFHGRISREEAERRIEDGQQRDGRFLVRERDNFSYAMCICHKRTTKHYRIDVLSTGELAIQDGRKFTSLMALVSHYTIMSDGLWCALTEPCPRPIQQQHHHPQNHQHHQAQQAFHKLPQAGGGGNQQQSIHQNGFHNAVQHGPFANQICSASLSQQANNNNNNIYCVPPSNNTVDTFSGQHPPHHMANNGSLFESAGSSLGAPHHHGQQHQPAGSSPPVGSQQQQQAHNAKQTPGALMCPNQSAAVLSIKAPIKEWLHTINHKWSQLIASKTNQQHQSLNSFLFGSSNPLNNHCRHRNHHHHHQPHSHHRRRPKNSCPRHSQHQHQQQCQTATGVPNGERHHRAPPACGHKNNTIGQQQPQQLAAAMNGNCNCCQAPDALYPSGSMIQNNRMAAGGGVVCGSLRSLPANNLILQQLGNGAGHANGNNSDQLVPGSLGGGGTQAQAAVPALNQTKVLLSCLPQNSGFMLDSQSFIGSPLFAVKTNSQTNAGLAAATIDGLNGANGNRACPANGTGGAGSDSSAGSGGGGRCGNNVDKLISPAQSISANLNGHHQSGGGGGNNNNNPYALSTADIYGSQTSTAIVNDHLLTSSSSSSGNNHSKEQQHIRQPSVDLKHHPGGGFHHQMASAMGAYHKGGTVVRYAGAETADGCRFARQPSAKTLTAPPKCPSGQTVDASYRQFNQNVTDQQQQYHQQAAATSRQTRHRLPVQHAGPILCGQHAGPAYRYTNCTGNEDNAFRPCVHSASMGVSNVRAIDDLHLPTAGTQLAGPAALTKFVQFQDGQCLRTHRDTKSIQMAYLLSRQEALNVLNSRGAGVGPSRAMQYNTSQSGRQQPQQPSHHRPTNNAPPMSASFAQNNHFAVSDNGPAPATATSQLKQPDLPEDFDLIDCDGNGFQFKYDPKLIKSSSIETLCGVGDDDDENIVVEDLSNFKTNSELLMSLQPCWPHYDRRTTPANGEHSFSPLIPMSANNCQQQRDDTAAGQPDQVGGGGKDQIQTNASAGNNCLASLLGSGSSSSAQARTTESQLNESWHRKHDLDELTTALLAELTASLKAQVDLKNKRSGLWAPNNEQHENGTHSSPSNQTDGGVNCGQAAAQHDAKNGATARAGETNPLELINEFDALIQNDK
jgi:hypothetical protein